MFFEWRKRQSCDRRLSTREGRHRCRLGHRKMLVEQLEDRRLLAVDPSWMIPFGDGLRYVEDIQVSDDGSIFAAFKMDDLDNVGSAGPIGLREFSPTGETVSSVASVDPGVGWDTYATAIDVEDPLHPAVYIGGYLGRGGNVFDLGSGMTLESDGNQDAFVAKLDGDGNALWARSFGKTSPEYSDYVFSISVQGSAVYVGGTFRLTVSFGDTTLTTSKVKGRDPREGFLMKMNADTGDVEWVEQFGGQGEVGVHGITSYTTLTGETVLYVSGKFQSDISVGGITLNAAPKNIDLDPYEFGNAFVAKVVDNGSSANFSWAEQFGGADAAVDVAGMFDQNPVVNDDGRVFLAGRFRGDTQVGEYALSSTEEAVFVTEIMESGEQVTYPWANRVTSSEVLSPRSLAVDDDLVYLTGRFSGAVEFESAGNLNEVVGSRGMEDSFLAKYNLDGSVRTVHRLGGDSYDSIAWPLAAKDGIAYAIPLYESLEGDAPAQAPAEVFPNAFPERSAASRDYYVLKLNSAAPVVRISSPIAGSEDTPITLAASAATGDLATDLSASIVWTDSNGVTLGTGTSIDVMLPSGTHKITASVTDPVSGLLGLAGTVIAITGNQPPLAVDDSAATDTETSVTVQVLDNDIDADNDMLTVADVTQPTNGAVVNNGTSVTYTPNPGFVGNDTFTYTVSDGNGGTDTGTVTMTVTDPSATTPIYVYDIRFESKRGNKDWRAVFEIRSDSNDSGTGDPEDNPVAGVWIEVEFAGVGYSGYTDADGVFRTEWVRDIGSGNHYADVVDLVLANYYWASLMDLEDDDTLVL